MPASPHPRIRIGTSGWHYRHWRGRFYPDSLTQAEWLSWYTRYFDCVELNNTFYQLPQSATLRDWVNQTSDDFRFILKASRLITHMKKLHNSAAAVRQFYAATDTLGQKRGPVLYQLPPNWHMNLERLSTFLAQLSPRQPVAFEFRDHSWETQTVYDCLRKYNAALCIYHLAGRESPAVITANFVYVRLHGPAAAYEGGYHGHTLRKWARRIDRWFADGLSVYVFFNNDQDAHAPHDANRLRHYLDLNSAGD